MAKIKTGSGYWKNSVRVDHKDLFYYYRAPVNKSDLRRKGRTLVIGMQTNRNSPGTMSIRLDGTQINTLKRILEVVGEIEQHHTFTN